MKISICDDDLLFVEQLKEYILKYFHAHTKLLPEIFCYTDGHSLLADPDASDLLFLDIDMPGITGIEAGRKIKEKDNKTIIFVITSFPEFLDEAMRFQVFRYLSKPLDPDRLFRNLKDALQQYHSLHFNVLLETKNDAKEMRI